MRLREVAAARVRFGYRRLTVLLRREGWRVNAKRIYRLYTEEGLMVRTKVRVRAARRNRVPQAVATAPNQRWSTAQRVAGSSAGILCGSVGSDRSNSPRSPGIVGATHVRDGRFASPLRRLKPITRRPIPQVWLGLHSRGGSASGVLRYARYAIDQNKRSGLVFSAEPVTWIAYSQPRRNR